jgi:hypothetical protein
MSLKQIKDQANLLRDENTGAIINVNHKGYQDYVSQRKRLQQQNDLVLNNQKEIDALKSDVSEIKDLLKVIVNRLQETK